MARTLFYDRLSERLRAQPNCVAAPDEAQVLFPVEDLSMEFNWPCYARPSAAFVRGSIDDEVANDRRYKQYLIGLAESGQRVCVINMHPHVRVPQIVAGASALIVADINLRSWERAINPRTISMPALPITVGAFDRTAKRIFATFRGVDTHPTRAALARLHDGSRYICQLVPPANHFGKLDARSGVVDPHYAQLLAAAVFAFVPRGDAEFSYRLLEVMSFGCIPIVISDGLVLPFDRTIDWGSIALHVPEKDVEVVPEILAKISAARIAALQDGVAGAYARCFADFDAIASTLVGEVAAVLRDMT
jgi:hypothetical protein